MFSYSEELQMLNLYGYGDCIVNYRWLFTGQCNIQGAISAWSWGSGHQNTTVSIDLYMICMQNQNSLLI